MRRDDHPATLSGRSDSLAAPSWLRRAALFVLAERSLRFLSVLPLVWLASFLWTHRRLRLEELLSDHPLPLALALGASVAGMASAGRAGASIERRLYRRTASATEILRRPPAPTRETRDAGETLRPRGPAGVSPDDPALEDQLLGSSGDLSTDGGAAGRTPLDDPGRPGEEAGLLCRRCARIYAQGAGAFCPDDDLPLEPAPVPHLLAGKYRFEKRIGGGGMGQVYRARDVSLSRDVAIKVLPRVSRQAVRRLRREARAAARLIHPNLGVIFAAETWRGMPMLVLEFLDGGTLEERIACGPVSVADVVDWGIRLAGALEAAHARKILHRDIKPSNIGFTTGGVPKLMDFGVVRLLDDPSSGITDDEGFGPLSPAGLLGSPGGGSYTLTATGRIAGTAPYLSPEAVQGMPPGPDFDVWSLTLTLYEALTGTNPFAEGSVERALTLILTAPVPDPRLVRPDCPEPVAAFFARALSSSFPERPGAAHELRERLELLRG